MPISINLAKGLDKAYEGRVLSEILDAPPSALAGLTERHDRALAELFGIRTVRDLGTNKYFALAGVLVALGNKVTEEGGGFGVATDEPSHGADLESPADPSAADEPGSETWAEITIRWDTAGRTLDWRGFIDYLTQVNNLLNYGSDVDARERSRSSGRPEPVTVPNRFIVRKVDYHNPFDIILLLPAGAVYGILRLVSHASRVRRQVAEDNTAVAEANAKKAQWRAVENVVKRELESLQSDGQESDVDVAAVTDIVVGASIEPSDDVAAEIAIRTREEVVHGADTVDE